ncbi:MAG: DUF3592 domain-containing protein [Acidimicrobiia bacterium]
MSPNLSRREFAIAVVALVLPLALLVWLHRAVVVEWNKSRSLAATGVRTDAAVIAAEAAGVPRSYGYRVTYRYTATGRDGTVTNHVATDDVDRATYEASTPGTALAIRYDRDDTARSAIVRNDRFADMVFIVGVVDLALLAAAVAIARSSRAEAKPATTAADGPT